MGLLNPTKGKVTVDNKEINSQKLYSEPEGLNTNQELPSVPKDSFKKGVYY